MKRKIILLGSTLLLPIVVNASSSVDVASILFLYFIEAFCSIHYSLFVLKPLSEMINKTGDSKKTFWILFFIRAGILLVVTPFYPNIYTLDFISLFIGAFIMSFVQIKKQISNAVSHQDATVVPTVNQKVNCPKCGYLVLDANKICPKCGTSLQGATLTIPKVKCEYCNEEMEGTLEKCPHCGAENKNKVTIAEQVQTGGAITYLNANEGTPFNKNAVDSIVFKSEKVILKDLITKELNNDSSNHGKTLKDVEVRKSIMTLIYALIIDILMVVYAAYHTELILILFLLLVLTIVYLILISKYNVTKYIMKEVKQRPDEKISYVTASIMSSGIYGKMGFKLIRLVILILAISVPIYFFQEPHFIYEKNGEDYALRYYTLGLFKYDTKIEIPETYNGKKITSIRGDVFKNVYYVEEVVLPDTINEIRGGAFQNCYSLKKINLPVGITEIHGSTFENDYELESIDIPEGVTRIGGSAFRECHKLTHVTIPKTVLEIGSSAFRRTALRNVCISQNAYVNERAFKETYPSIVYYENNCESNTTSGDYYGY